jgi:AraC-like DNA-binding protein
MNKEMEETVLKVAEYSNDEKERFLQRLHWMFVAGLVGFIAYAVISVLGLENTAPYETIASFGLGVSFGMVIIGVIDYYVPANLLWLIMLYPVWIFLMLCWHVRKYRRWCEDNFSSMEMIDVQWVVRYLIILALLGISYYFIVFWYVPNRMFTQQWMLFLILAYGTEQILFRKDPWAEMEQEEQPTQDYDPDWRTQLEQWMAEVKPYRNVDFRLDDLRQILPLNRTYLSQLINNAYGCNFFNWVNQYRLEEAKKLMIDHPEMKLTDVATYCGFSSLAVFSRAFTRYTGLSPRDWIRSFDMSES